MPSTTTIWNPDDWEIFALGLLNCRHGVLNVHKVPAKDQGDLGIDYYCNKDSVAYQCYAVEEPIGVAERAKKQKDKITKDLGKLQKKQRYRIETLPRRADKEMGPAQPITRQQGCQHTLREQDDGAPIESAVLPRH